VSKQLSDRLLGPLKSISEASEANGANLNRASELLRVGKVLAERLRQSENLTPLPTADEIVPGDIYSCVFGYERAKLLLDPELAPRRVRASQRLALVQELSLQGRLVTDIARAASLRPSTVVKLRAKLRRQGRLPPL